jgi:outer membrane protein assembly factor BamB
MKSRKFAVTTLISALAAGVMPAVAGEPGADWPMFRGDLQLTGVARGALPADLATRWTFTRDEAFSATAAIVGDTVYAACEDGVLYALDLADGSLRWQYAGGEDVAFRASPTVAGGTVYLGDDLGVFHAVDAQTGARRWVFQTEGEIVSSALVIVERVVFGSYDGTLYCLDTKDGSKLWAAETEDRLHATPSLFDESLLIGGCDGKLHVIDLKSGKAQAGIELDAVTGASAAVSGKLAYLGTHGNEVLAVDFARRKVAWRYHHPERQFPFMSSAAVFDGKVIVGGRDKRVRALDAASGKQRWAFVAKGRVDSSPVVVGERVYVGSSDGNLYALDRKTGKRVWRFEAAEPITASPAVGRESLVIGTLDGTLYCFGGQAKGKSRIQNRKSRIQD